MSDAHRAPPPFRFGSWLRLHGVDIITMALMGALGLGIYEAGSFLNFTELASKF